MGESLLLRVYVVVVLSSCGEEKNAAGLHNDDQRYSLKLGRDG